MTSHSTYDDKLLDYLYEELAPEEAADFAAHVQGCAACQREIEGMRGVRAQVQQLPRIEPSDEALGRMTAQILHQAAQARPAGEAPKGHPSRTLGSTGNLPSAEVGKLLPFRRKGLLAVLLHPASGILAAAAVALIFVVGKNMQPTPPAQVVMPTEVPVLSPAAGAAPAGPGLGTGGGVGGGIDGAKNADRPTPERAMPAAEGAEKKSARSLDQWAVEDTGGAGRDRKAKADQVVATAGPKDVARARDDFDGLLAQPKSAPQKPAVLPNFVGLTKGGGSAPGQAGGAAPRGDANDAVGGLLEGGAGRAAGGDPAPPKTAQTGALSWNARKAPAAAPPAPPADERPPAVRPDPREPEAPRRELREQAKEESARAVPVQAAPAPTAPPVQFQQAPVQAPTTPPMQAQQAPMQAQQAGQTPLRGELDAQTQRAQPAQAPGQQGYAAGPPVGRRNYEQTASDELGQRTKSLQHEDAMNTMTRGGRVEGLAPMRARFQQYLQQRRCQEASEVKNELERVYHGAETMDEDRQAYARVCGEANLAAPAPAESERQMMKRAAKPMPVYRSAPPRADKKAQSR